MTVAATANISNVTLNLGDGTMRNLGPISGSTTVPHTYQAAGTYTVTATASDAAGCSETVSTAVTILPGQPPAVIVTASDTTPAVGQTVTFTATVSGNTSTIVRYDWDFGSGASSDRPSSTTSNRQSVVYATVGTYTVTVVVTQATGPQGDGQTAVVVGDNADGRRQALNRGPARVEASYAQTQTRDAASAASLFSFAQPSGLKPGSHGTSQCRRQTGGYSRGSQRSAVSRRAGTHSEMRGLPEARSILTRGFRLQPEGC